MIPFSQRARNVTPRQLPRRSELNILSKAWSTDLLPVERNGWDSWAAASPRTDSMGTPYFMSGFNAFCGFNSARLMWGVAIRTTSPAGTGFGVGLGLMPANIAISAASGDVTIGQAAIPLFSATLPTDIAVFQISRQHNPGVSSVRFAFTGLTVFAGIGGPPSPFPSVTPYPFGILVEGQKVWVRARGQKINGKLSNIEEGEVFVAA